MIALLLTASALAQEPTRVDPPLRVAGEPWGARVTAYALPRQKPEYLTDDRPERVCTVGVTLQPSGEFSAVADDCPEAMSADAVAATQRWGFTLDADSPTLIVVHYVLIYSAIVGTTTLHAEVDPGPDGRDQEGPPGLQLVFPATPRTPARARLPRRARRAGVEDSRCTLQVRVSADGRAFQATPTDCPPSLVKDAQRRAGKSRWTPRTVDGIPEDALVAWVIDYVP